MAAAKQHDEQHAHWTSAHSKKGNKPDKGPLNLEWDPQSQKAEGQVLDLSQSLTTNTVYSCLAWVLQLNPNSNTTASNIYVEMMDLETNRCFFSKSLDLFGT